MNIQQIKKAAETAKARTSDKRWTNAINAAVKGVESGKWIVTELVDSIIVTTENGTYHANGSCQCKAFKLGTPCKHRALARLIQIADEADRASLAARRCDVIIADIKAIADEREELISSITNMWPATWPPLYTELLARFGRSNLNMLDDDSLRRVRLAIAM